MALFTSYAPPGVYTTEIFVSNTATLTGTARIPVIIGEGQQFFTIPNYELFRGSSPVQDDQSFAFLFIRHTGASLPFELYPESAFKFTAL